MKNKQDTNKSRQLPSRLTALREALTMGGDRLEPEPAANGQTVVDRLSQRMQWGEQLTIVALVGATGSGKSTLFNAICGAPLSDTGARRPMTSAATACVWGEDGADELLDWLQVGRRHRVAANVTVNAKGDNDLNGLVLLDMPDHDSTQVAHRQEVDRLVDLVDLLVWVVDPQKYADDALHSGYLQRFCEHADVMMVVLNQADRLTATEEQTCMADLRRLLVADGLPTVPAITLSATQGQGLPEFRECLVRVVQSHGAAVQRASADLNHAATALAASVTENDVAAIKDSAAGVLDDALAQSAGIETIVKACVADYRRQATAALGWPLTRWWRLVRPDPLRRLRLGGNTQVSGDLTRTSLPTASAVQAAQVDDARRDVTTAVAQQLPRRWADQVRAIASQPHADLVDALDQAVVGVDLSFKRPRWWRIVNVLQLLLIQCALVGLVWLVFLGILSWLRIDEAFTPDVGPLPLPTLLLLGGLLIGWVVTVLMRSLALRNARRRGAAVRKRIMQAVHQVSLSHVLNPIATIINEHRVTREHLARVRG